MFAQFQRHVEQVVILDLSLRDARRVLAGTLISIPFLLAYYILDVSVRRIYHMLAQPFFSFIFVQFFLFLFTSLALYNQSGKLERRRQEAALKQEQSISILEPFPLEAYPCIDIKSNKPKLFIASMLLLTLALLALVLYGVSTMTDQLPILSAEKGLPGLLIVDLLVSVVYSLGYVAFCIGLVISSRGGRQRIVATVNGVFAQIGREVNYIPWQEARLFAMIGMEMPMGGEEQKRKIRSAPPIFELASASQSVRWTTGYAQGISGVVFGGVKESGKRNPGDDKLIKQFEALSDIVASHTGLELQDLRP